MEMESKLYDLLQEMESATLTAQEAVQKLNSQDGLTTSIIDTLSDQYKKQVAHPIYSALFELYRSGDTEAKCYVLQYLPSILWIYLSAKSRRDKQGYGKLEAILIAIYNAEVHERQNPKTFRLPSLSRPSIYHETSLDIMMSQSALTESALSRHEQAETPIQGPTNRISTVTASNRMSVLCVALRQYYDCIGFLNKSSHNSFWLMAIRVAIAGFSKLCTPETGPSHLDDVLSNDELSRLAGHPRIPVNAEFIQELTHSLYFLMYNGCPVQAAKAIDSLHFRASYGLLAPANVLTNAIHHSLKPTNGLPHDGPLGLKVHLSEPQDAKQDYNENCLAALTTKGMGMESPMDYYSLQNTERDNEENTFTQESTPLKSHKKSNSTGYWKSSFQQHSSKTNVELKDISVTETDGRKVAKKAFSEDNIVVTSQTENSDLCTTKL